MSSRSSARKDLQRSGHEYVIDSSDDTGMAFSPTNWRYWLLGLAAVFALAGIIMAMVTGPTTGDKSESFRLIYTLAVGIVGLLCTAVVPGVFLLCALASASDRTKRGCFLMCVLSALGLSTVYVFFAGMGLLVNGTSGSRAANEQVYKQAFETLDSYAASADRARDAFFDAGGVRVKTLIGADTIRQRLALVNKLKTACAESTKLLEGAEPALDAWFESAGVSVFARHEFWEERHGHEYTEALKNLRAAETRLATAAGEYLAVMHKMTGRFAMADSDNVYFRDQEDLDTYQAALKKLDPSLRLYDDAQDRLKACRDQIQAREKKGR